MIINITLLSNVSPSIQIGDDLLSPSQGRVLQIMHKFCQICVSCITSIPETKVFCSDTGMYVPITSRSHLLQRDELLKLAESCNACEAAIFLRQCYSDNQVKATKIIFIILIILLPLLLVINLGTGESSSRLFAWESISFPISCAKWTINSCKCQQLSTKCNECNNLSAMFQVLGS